MSQPTNNTPQIAPLDAWLAELGFVRHPFLPLRAEEDEKLLLECFVPHPGCFEQFADYPTVAVFAPRGGGKTANRLKLINQKFSDERYLVTQRLVPSGKVDTLWSVLLDTLAQSVLNLAEKQTERFLSWPAWSREFLHRFVLDRCGQKALDEQITRWRENNSSRREKKPDPLVIEDETQFDLLDRLVCDFARRCPRKLAAAQLAEFELWKLAADHLKSAGILHVDTLIDSSSIDVDIIKQFLTPPIPGESLACPSKLFLPIEHIDVIKDSPVYQNGQMLVAHLEWPARRLEELARKRMEASGGKPFDFIAANVSARPLEELALAATRIPNAGAPLAMLWLAQTVFDSRGQNFASDGTLLLTDADWQPVRAVRQGTSCSLLEIQSPLHTFITLVHSISAPVPGQLGISYGTRPLRETIDQCFNTEELRTLCSDLKVEYDNLPGEGKSSKARELVGYFLRRNRILDLLQVCEKERPNVSWRDVVLEG